MDRIDSEYIEPLVRLDRIAVYLIAAFKGHVHSNLDLALEYGAAWMFVQYFRHCRPWVNQWNANYFYKQTGVKTQ